MSSNIRSVTSSELLYDLVLPVSGILLGSVWVATSFTFTIEAEEKYRDQNDKYTLIDERKQNLVNGLKTLGYSLLWPFSKAYVNI